MKSFIASEPGLWALLLCRTHKLNLQMLGNEIYITIYNIKRYELFIDFVVVHFNEQCMFIE